MLDLNADRKKTLGHARQIVDSAKAANRDLTAAESATVEADLARVKELDRQIAGRNMVKSVMSLDGGHWDDDNPEGNGDLFSASAKAGIVQAVKTRTAFRTDVDVKAALTSGTLLPTGGQGVEAGLYPNLFPISTLFRSEAASGPTVRYYRMGAGTAAVVPEGTLKPDAGVTITPVDVAIEKIATTARFSDEMADDAPFLLAYLQAELAAAVATRENQEVLDTFAATSGVLTGTGAAADVVDLVADAIAGQEAISGSTPTAVIANPTTVATIRKAKASTAGTYVLDPLTAGPTSIHGVRVVSTPATPPGTAWVVSGNGVVIYRRGQLTAEIGLNADDWQSNMRTLRVEERMAPAVVRPSALTRLTLT
jgi:HK97 family phage major capsid protein